MKIERKIMESKGWIKLFRKFREWEWYQDSNTKDLFLEILLTANTVDKKWHGIEIKRGQLLTSRIKLSNILGISEQSVRTSLTKLKSTNEITIKSTNRYTLITVNKFNDYQQLTNKLTNNQPTTNQQLTTTKNIKNKENNKEEKSVALTNKYPTLDSVKESDFEYIANKYQVPLSFVKSKYDDLIIWAESKPNNPKLKGRNYRLTLMKFVKDDSLQIKKDYAKQNQYRGIDASNI